MQKVGWFFTERTLNAKLLYWDAKFFTGRNLDEIFLLSALLRCEYFAEHTLDAKFSHLFYWTLCRSKASLLNALLMWILFTEHTIDAKLLHLFLLNAFLKQNFHTDSREAKKNHRSSIFTFNHNNQSKFLNFFFIFITFPLILCAKILSAIFKSLLYVTQNL